MAQINNISFNPFSLQWGEKIKKDLETVCTEFESIFLTSLLKELEKTSLRSDLLGEGIESEIVRGMWTQVLAQKIAEGGGVGIKDMLYKQLSDSNYQARKCQKFNGIRYS